jgi:hypothetical protein
MLSNEKELDSLHLPTKGFFRPPFLPENYLPTSLALGISVLISSSGFFSPFF